MAEKICVMCGVTFRPRGPQKNCSRECSYQSENKKRRKIKITERCCVICGGNFEARKSSQDTCGKSCYQKILYQRKKDYIKEYKRQWYLNNPNYNLQYKAKNKEDLSAKKKSYGLLNSDKIKYQQKLWRESYRGNYMKKRSLLIYELGFEPTEDIIEEATALRLLNRAIKKAGE